MHRLQLIENLTIYSKDCWYKSCVIVRNSDDGAVASKRLRCLERQNKCGVLAGTTFMFMHHPYRVSLNNTILLELSTVVSTNLITVRQVTRVSTFNSRNYP